MDEASLGAVAAEFDDFARQVFSSLARSDQRATGGLYLQGLMLDGRRKSMLPMAERLGVDHQRLQQFVTSSPWEEVPVRRTLARLAHEVITPDAWVLDDTGHAKDGPASACVARQYSGTLGKVGNCQIAVSLHAVTDAASSPLDGRLFVPESWEDQKESDPEQAAQILDRVAVVVPTDRPDSKRSTPKSKRRGG